MPRTSSATRSKKASETRKKAEDAALPALPTELPLLPIRDNVHFPGLIFPLLVGREKSVQALDEAMATHQHILLVAQRQAGTEDPDPEEMFSVGVVAEIVQILKVPDGTARVMLEGKGRARVVEWRQSEPFFQVVTEPMRDSTGGDLEVEALMRSVLTQFEQIAQTGKNIPPEAVVTVLNTDDPGLLADHVAWHLPSLRVEIKQELLETLSAEERLQKLSVLLSKELEIIEIQKNIRHRVEKEMGDTQREFILREQLKAIHQELGERDERQSEVDDYRTAAIEARMPDTVLERTIKEIDRLEKMPYAAPEGVVIRSYLDTLLALPWSKADEETLDIEAAEAILD
ncbi:MAG: LON peptidase substrate-binding domain-containing protein, partial [Armatimonadota bacterium]|nr:LON peptidase substrate-binding domain-containing protein [Armatimonadota bacterium]